MVSALIALCLACISFACFANDQLCIHIYPKNYVRETGIHKAKTLLRATVRKVPLQGYFDLDISTSEASKKCISLFKIRFVGATEASASVEAIDDKPLANECSSSIDKSKLLLGGDHIFYISRNHDNEYSCEAPA